MAQTKRPRSSQRRLMLQKLSERSMLAGDVPLIDSFLDDIPAEVVTNQRRELDEDLFLVDLLRGPSINHRSYSFGDVTVVLNNARLTSFSVDGGGQPVDTLQFDATRVSFEPFGDQLFLSGVSASELGTVFDSFYAIINVGEDGSLTIADRVNTGEAITPSGTIDRLLLEERSGFSLGNDDSRSVPKIDLSGVSDGLVSRWYDHRFVFGAGDGLGGILEVRTDMQLDGASTNDGYVLLTAGGNDPFIPHLMRATPNGGEVIAVLDFDSQLRVAHTLRRLPDGSLELFGSFESNQGGPGFSAAVILSNDGMILQPPRVTSGGEFAERLLPVMQVGRINEVSGVEAFQKPDQTVVIRHEFDGERVETVVGGIEGDLFGNGLFDAGGVYVLDDGSVLVLNALVEDVLNDASVNLRQRGVAQFEVRATLIQPTGDGSYEIADRADLGLMGVTTRSEFVPQGILTLQKPWGQGAISVVVQDGRLAVESLETPADAFPVRMRDQLLLISSAGVESVDPADVNFQTLTDRALAEFDVHDVNRDGSVSALDALMVINQLSRNNSQALQLEPDSRRTGLALTADVNGDGEVSALDALKIINRLNATTGVRGSSEPASALISTETHLDDDDESNGLRFEQESQLF